ncbi:hypothetical protein C8J55DRAFT_560978 [Lentinula edodes]|uniref:Uncharacterized protein n=1 Tax=Lentinula lateritia TaxID=40482 RepID=A0A9W9ABT3_9AGAR|nr:hypothetical protein C8J55DRAFT_560978 [Lentinula edodes]
MLSQTMKFLLGSLVLALMVSSQVQAAAIPVASLRATGMDDFTPAPASNSAAARRSSEMLEMRDTYSGTAEWGSQRRSLASLVSPSTLKSLAGNIRPTGSGEKKQTVDGPDSKRIHHQVLGQLAKLSSTFGKKKEEAPNPPKPGAEPPKPPTEAPKPHDPAAPHPEGKSKTEQAKDLAELGTTAAGTVGAVASTYKGIKGDGGATPAPDGSPTGGVGDAPNGPTVPPAGKTA